MWRPHEVVDRHRCRATVVWILLLVTICTYTVWILAVALRKRENPSTSLTQSNARYKFPDVSVCFKETAGCDSYALDEGAWCASTALSESYFSFKNERVGNVTASSHTGCVDFNISSVDVGEGEQDQSYTTTASIVMKWELADSKEHVARAYRESVQVYLSHSAAIAVPYNRMATASNTSDGYTYCSLTTVGIGLTERHGLDHRNRVFYSANAIATTSSVIVWNESDADRMYGYLGMDVSQGLFSHAVITEIDPLDVLELLGSVGGFWELLLVTWGLFFISSAKLSPRQKARNFTKSYKRGIGRARSMSAMEGISGRSHPSSSSEHKETQLTGHIIDPAGQRSDQTMSFGDY